MIRMTTMKIRLLLRYGHHPIRAEPDGLTSGIEIYHKNGRDSEGESREIPAEIDRAAKTIEYGTEYRKAYRHFIC